MAPLSCTLFLILMPVCSQMCFLSFSSEPPRRGLPSQQHQRNHQRHKELLKKNILLTKMKMMVDNSVLSTFYFKYKGILFI